MRALFDTNIIIDYLNGIEKAKKELDAFKERYISMITYIEVLVGLSNETTRKAVEVFLHSFNVVDINKEIADIAIILRREYRLKTPDAIVLACAEHANALFITRDMKDFADTLPIVKIPYQL